MAFALVLARPARAEEGEEAAAGKLEFQRRWFELSLHGGLATPQSRGVRTAFVFSDSVFLRLSSSFGGPTFAIDLVRRTFPPTPPENTPTRIIPLVSIGYRLAPWRGSRFDPWLEPVGVGIGYVRPAAGLDVFVTDDFLLGFACKLPIFFARRYETLDVGAELTLGLTAQLGGPPD